MATIRAQAMSTRTAKALIRASRRQPFAKIGAIRRGRYASVTTRTAKRGR